MGQVVAFLRAINVGGHTVRMTELARHFEALGLNDVSTFIASGNVVFRTGARDLAALERKIERHLEKTLGYEVRTFLRTEDEVVAVAGLNPFGKAAEGDERIYVGFLPSELNAAERKVALGFRDKDNEFHVAGREFYWLSRTKFADSTFSYARFEKALKKAATFRNINTVQRLVGVLGERGA